MVSLNAGYCSSTTDWTEENYKDFFKNSLPLVPTIQIKSSMDFFTIEKSSVIGLPKFITVNMAGKCYQEAIFSTENLLFFNFCYGSPISDDVLS